MEENGDGRAEYGDSVTEELIFYSFLTSESFARIKNYWYLENFTLHLSRRTQNNYS